MTAENDDYSSTYVCFNLLSTHVLKERKKSSFFSLQD